MKMNPEDLLGFCNKHFEWQRPVLSLWQTLAENFYPERADFTVTRNLGTELADSLLSSYPLLVRRDLGNSFSAMLRDGDWFQMTVNDPDYIDHSGKEWLQEKSRWLKRLMYRREAGFVRATKEGDHDYATFGQPVLSVERNRNYNGLLFRAWHLRDCAWWEGSDGQVCGLVRKWKPTLRQAIDTFGLNALHPNMVKDHHKRQLKEVELYHVWIETETYGEDTEARYASIYLDTENKHLIEEVFNDERHYVVPRFQTIAGSPYAYSPATVVGLPDARMLQAMTHTLMEAGERYARPPIIATSKVIQGNVDLSSDGITWVDKEYDEKLGAALRPLAQDRGGFPIGLELRDDIKDTLQSAFYINKLALPEIGREMTAYEVAERMKQYRRENLPLFAPVESEYNGALCEQAFEVALKMGLMGSEQDIPESLRGNEIEFKFESPLTESEEEKKATRFNQVSQMLADAIQFDQGAAVNIDFDTALRDAIEGIGAPARWLNSREEVEQTRQQVAQEQAAMAMAQQQEAVNG